MIINFMLYIQFFHNKIMRYKTENEKIQNKKCYKMKDKNKIKLFI